ncbi:MAG: flagellar hook-associated protein FlgK [candidate division Zixibacteria bacterium HGW-Zixibacteria-1]|nr:MAG: flagellar hook-associated protein FlgK [candidate division Zixibacteria bacterium HGW-Zixibacteria-1]
MSGLFDGLELGKRALSTHQLWLNTIGHNVANANTPGYTRQRVHTTTTMPYEHSVGPVGTGVTATDIYHVRDLFLGQQYRQENVALGQWTSMEKSLTQIEALFAEPNAASLSDQMDQFWNAWSDMANNPESLAARSALKEQTNLMTGSFHRLYNQMTDLRKSVDEDIALVTQQVNQYTGELASLNMQIARTELGGENANDLRDKRDYLIDQLSELVNVNVAEQKNGTATVYIGSLAIVEGTSSFKIGTYKSGAGAISVNNVVWQGSEKDVKVLGGQLKGLLDTRDKAIPKYLEALDDIAAELINNVNSLHQTGYGLDGSTGINFFNVNYTSAGNFKLSDEIENNVNRIAASLSGEVGDNRNALAIADLRTSALMSRGTATMSEFYSGLMGQIGIEAGTARNTMENYQLLVSQLDNSRQAVQGVSLDEEMTQMIKYQQAYDAAARVITVMDEALSTVIKEMGIVGR